MTKLEIKLLDLRVKMHLITDAEVYGIFLTLNPTETKYVCLHHQRIWMAYMHHMKKTYEFKKGINDVVSYVMNYKKEHEG